MPINNSITIKTRISDLDSLRHVNNGKYEQFCTEGRLRLLEEQGWPLETLLNKGIVLRPLASHVKFLLQQKAGTDLTIHTEAFPLGNGIVHWDHHIKQPDGNTIAHLQARLESVDYNHKPIDLMPAADENLPQVLIEDVPDYSGNCSRVTSSYSAIYTDMDVFGTLPLAAYWRIFEEGRHMFGEQLGISREKMIHLDTNIFWVAGTYRCYKPIFPGQQIRIDTWLEAIDRFRAYFRQEIRTGDGAYLLGASREQHLIVSLSQARTKLLPPELLETLKSYIEEQNQAITK